MAPLLILALNTLAPLLISKAERAIMPPEQKAEVVVAAVKAIPSSKTMWFSFLLALLGLVEQYSSLLSSLIGEGRTGQVLLVISAITAVLRVLTNQPLQDKA